MVELNNGLNCAVTVERIEKKLTVEKVVDHRTGETERVFVKIHSVQITITAPFGELTFTSTKRSGRWGMWRDNRNVTTARRTTQDSWVDVYSTLRRFAPFQRAVSAIAEAKQLML